MRCYPLLFGILLSLWGPLVVAASGVESYLNEARSYLDQGKLNAAVIQLKNALQGDPNNMQARFLLGQVYLRSNDGVAAEKELQKARELGLARQEWLVPLAKAYLLQGQYERLFKNIDVNPDDPASLRSEVLSLRGSAAVALKRTDEARTNFTEALKLNPDNITAMLGNAQLALMAGELTQAMVTIDKALTINSGSPEAWLMKGEVLRLQKNYPESVAAFQKVLELQPNNWLARIGRVQSLLAQGELDKALAEVETVRKAYPHLPQANYLYGFIMLQKNNLAAAQEALQQVMKVAPEHLPSQFLLGLLNYQQNNLQQAQDYLARILKRQPENLQARKLLAATEMKLNNPKQAIELLDTGLSQAPQDAGLLALLGSAYMQHRDFDKGTEYLQKAAELAPDVSAIHTQLALSHLATGELEQAETQLQKAVDLGQGLIQADVLLVYTHLQQREFDKAIAAAGKLVEKRPDDPMPHNLLGVAYMAKGNDPQARQEFEKTLKLKPDFAGATINLAQLDLKAGDKDAARRRYQELLAKDTGNLAALQGLINLAGQEGHPEEALRLLEKAWERNPNAPRVGLALAGQYLQRGDSLKALNVLRSLDSANPNNPAIVFAQGQALLAAGKTDDALASFRRLVELQPQSPEPWLWIAQTQFQLKNTKAAAEAVNKSLAIKGDYEPALAFKTQLQLADNRVEEALNSARTLQRQSPSKPVGYQLEGAVYMQQKNYAKAVAAYQTAYGKAPSSPLALALANAQWESHDQEVALKTLRQWLTTDPQDVQARTQLGIYLELLKRQNEAITEYEQILQRTPDNVIVLNNLAGLYGNLGDARGIKYAERAVELTQKNPGLTARLPEIMDTLGWVLVQNNQVQRGLDILKQAAVQAPQIAAIRYHLAVAYNKAGQPQDARKELEKLLKSNKDFPEVNEAQDLLKSLQ
jgi:putative PEP-CTERM system TPR-repeat lipoprotein